MGKVILRESRSVKKAISYPLNPKLDSQTQRLLQCSLWFDGVVKRLAPKSNPAMQDEPRLRGGAFPRGVAPKRREFAQ